MWVFRPPRRNMQYCPAASEAAGTADPTRNELDRSIMPLSAHLFGLPVRPIKNNSHSYRTKNASQLQIIKSNMQESIASKKVK